MDEQLGRIKGFVDKVSKYKEVKAIYLFGSRATGKAGPRSDWDLVIILETPNLELESEIFSLADGEIDLSFFHRLPLYIKARVFKEGKLLLCKDDDFLAKLKFKVISSYLENKSLYAEVY